MIEQLTFIHFFAAACIVELLFIFVFRKTQLWGSGKKWSSINKWYTNLRWTAVILDILSILIGFYIAKFIFEYAVKEKMITKENEIFKYLGILLCVQIIHDFSFYFFIIKNSKQGSSQVMDEFIDYSKTVGINAVIGDSLMYISSIPILYIIYKMRNDITIFTILVSLYIVGYLIYQKPLS